MATPRLSSAALAIRIVPQRMRWPKRGASPAWAAAHDCVHAFENIVRDVESEIIALEEDKGRSIDSIRRRRVEICENALARLVDFRPFEAAQRALCERVRVLESLENRTPDEMKALQDYKQARTDLSRGVDASKRTVEEISKATGGRTGFRRDVA